MFWASKWACLYSIIRIWQPYWILAAILDFGDRIRLLYTSNINKSWYLRQNYAGFRGMLTADFQQNHCKNLVIYVKFNGKMPLSVPLYITISHWNDTLTFHKNDHIFWSKNLHCERTNYRRKLIYGSLESGKSTAFACIGHV